MPKSDKEAIRQAVQALQGAGYRLAVVWDGGEYVHVHDDESEAIEAITAVGEATLYVRHPGRKGMPGMFFVLGNNPAEVIADYNVSLEPVLGPLTEGWWD